MVRSSGRKATQQGWHWRKGARRRKHHMTRGDGRSGTGALVERCKGMGGATQGDGRSGAGGWAGRREGMGGATQGYGWGGAGVWVERREGMGGAVREHGRSGTGTWAGRRGDLGGTARGLGWGGAEGTSELRGNGSSSNEKDAVLRGRTRRLQTLNSVWKGNYCSGIGDGGAIKSTKQREASAVPYRFVMVIPSVMKLSSPK